MSSRNRHVVDSEQLLRWKEAITGAINKHVFDLVQFICSEEDEQYGSDWQQAVCDKIGATDPGSAKVFWNTMGMVEARKILNRRRQNTNTAMKKLFLGRGSPVIELK